MRRGSTGSAAPEGLRTHHPGSDQAPPCAVPSDSASNGMPHARDGVRALVVTSSDPPAAAAGGGPFPEGLRGARSPSPLGGARSGRHTSHRPPAIAGADRPPCCLLGAGHSVRLLYIEDDETASSYVTKGLERKGFLVDNAPDARSGFERATKRLYDLVLLDVMLPDKSGLELLRDLLAA